MVDYVLTVSVSIVAAVLAITSAAPSLHDHAVGLSMLLTLALLFGNLHGLRESGLIFSIPAYGFIIDLAMVAIGIGKGLTVGWPVAEVPHPLPVGTASAIGVLALLRAFASGCSALTGVEAISNGVTAFREPQARNAASALVSMGVLSITMFLGITVLAYQMDARPSETVSVISEVARGVFPSESVLGFGFIAVQVFTAAILFLAANSAYQGFPRLLALLAKDGYAPRQFRNLGDRLVYSNGLIVLTVVAALLIVVFNAEVEALLHLYLIGGIHRVHARAIRHGPTDVATRHELPRRTVATRLSLNSLGGALTGIVLVVVTITKFTQGGWMVTVAVPLIVIACLGVSRHYKHVAKLLAAGYQPRESVRKSTVVLVVTQIDDATLEALRYVESLVGRAFHPVHVVDETGPSIARVWNTFHNDYPEGVPELELIARKGSLARSVIKYTRTLSRASDEYVTVVVPELFRTNSIGSIVESRSRSRFTSVCCANPALSSLTCRSSRDRPRRSPRSASPGTWTCLFQSPASTMQRCKPSTTQPACADAKCERSTSTSTSWRPSSCEGAGRNDSSSNCRSFPLRTGNSERRCWRRSATHERPEHRLHGRDARTRRHASLATSPAQPTRAVPQAIAALRRARDPHDRALPYLTSAAARWAGTGRRKPQAGAGSDDGRADARLGVDQLMIPPRSSARMAARRSRHIWRASGVSRAQSGTSQTTRSGAVLR